MRKFLIAFSIVLICGSAFGQSSNGLAPVSSPGFVGFNYAWNPTNSSWDRLVTVPPNGDGFSAGTPGYLGTFSIPYVYNGSSFDRQRSIIGADPLLTGGSFTGVPAVNQVTAFFDANGIVWSEKAFLGNLFGRIVSPTNTQIQQALEMRQLRDYIAITATCSAGTAALTIESSVDNSNWLTIDSIVAAATNTKQYINTTVGATLALSPLAFRFIRITVATCGVSNTSTLNFSIK